MKKTLFGALLSVLLTLLGAARAASAKGPAVKLSISGGALTKAIEVVDPRILSISNPWAGQFLDGSREALKESPRGLRRYEVSFYVERHRGDVRMMYVVYYYPNRSHKQGYIYLPGKTDTWYSLNESTIIRGGQDGKWNYASPVWEDLIKAVIARAEAARSHGF